MTDNTSDAWGAPPAPMSMPPSPPSQRRVSRKTATVATIVGLAGGGLVGGFMVARAATATPTPSPASSPSGSGSAQAPGQAGDHGPGGGQRLGGANDAAEDQQTIADAIGISGTQLLTELKADGTIAAVAKAHNVDVAKVVAAIVAAQGKEIDAAVAAGTLTQAQADQMKADVTQRATDQVNGTGHGPDGHGGGPAGGPGGPAQEDLDVVAGVLGISSSQLQTDLQGGQTIAAVAKAQNVDVDKAISAWVASENKEIDDRVTAGQLTAAQAADAKQQTQQRVTDEVNGTGHPGGPGDGHGHGQPRGGGAPGSSSSSSSTTSGA